ncbi:MAG TPA: alternative ribosome rescue aminoacyl-tRNA hydrolase ArfB [Pirellulales bacterium]|jgi:ribosome-associated protein|nr:alternative ribosome rescue aminoacyl-tRNA hydrolase ArfB [Pirellulales bacterium]
MSQADTYAPRPNAVLAVNSRLRIPLAEFEFSFSRSSGPGGQNVNKVNSKALLRWPIRNSPSLPEAIRGRFLQKYGNRVTTDGDLLVGSQRYRDQGRNIDDCLEKLRTMLADVVAPPVRRKRTKPTRGSIERRLQTKRQRSDKKQGRRMQDEG